MHKPIISLISVAGVIVLGMFAYMGQGSGRPSASASHSDEFAGYITDLKCMRNVNADCNRKCFAAGEDAALLLDGTGEILRLKNAKEAKKHPGAHVDLKGIRENNVIVVSNITAK